MKKDQTYQSNRKSADATALVRKVSVASSVALLASATVAQASTDYPPATWKQACSGNWYTSGNGKRFYVEHDMEGYYASTISYLQSCNTSVTIHYCVNGKQDASSDYAPGDITQMVRDSYYAWHARCWNSYSMGTEHEGFVSNPAWYTESMYKASATLTKSKAEKYGFAKDRNHIIGHNEGENSAWRSYASANLGIDPTCNTHDDPGPYWDWTHYMQLVMGVYRTPYGAVSQNADGHMEIFAVGDDNAAWHSWQGSRNGIFGSFASAGGSLQPGCIVAKNFDGRLEVFAIGTDNAVWHSFQTAINSGWSSWYSLGGNVKKLAAASNADGHLELFGIGTNNIVYHQWQTAPNGGWTGSWATLNSSGIQVTNLAVASNQDGHIEVFGTGLDGQVWHTWQTAPNGGWQTGWESLSGNAKALTAAANQDGRLEVFIIDATDSKAYHKFQGSPNGIFSSSWYVMNSSGIQVTSLAIGSNADGRLELFGIGLDGQTWHAWQTVVNGGWTTSWATLGGWSSSITVGANWDGHLELFGVGTDRQLYHIWQTGPNGGWGTSWQAMGGAWRGL